MRLNSIVGLSQDDLFHVNGGVINKTKSWFGTKMVEGVKAVEGFAYQNPKKAIVGGLVGGVFIGTFAMVFFSYCYYSLEEKIDMKID